MKQNKQQFSINWPTPICLVSQSSSYYFKLAQTVEPKLGRPAKTSNHHAGFSQLK